MQYVKVTFVITGDADSDIVVAVLSDAGYEGFEESRNELFAYCEESKFDESELKNIAENYRLNYSTEIIPAQNWNALWESNFQPVVVEGFCTIRAHFHDTFLSYDTIILRPLGCLINNDSAQGAFIFIL